MKLGNVPLDGATMRLIAAARATHMSEVLPKESGRQLVASARAVRLYLEAIQFGLAEDQLLCIELLMSDLEDPELSKAYARLTGDVRRALKRWAAA